MLKLNSKFKKVIPLLAFPFFLGSCGAEEGSTSRTFYNSHIDLLQLQAPQTGDTLVTLHTTYGDIVIRMFPEETPLAYENFVTHARNGFYDGVIFHRVIEGFMIQTGDPLGTGTGGGSIWGDGFALEPSENLRHIRGAVAMAHPGSNYGNGSQFYIVQNNEVPEHFESQLIWFMENQDLQISHDNLGNELYVRDFYTTEMAEAFLYYGGAMSLDLVTNAVGHTVFGQVVSGMDVVDEIANTEIIDQIQNRPVSNIEILYLTVETYAG